MADSRSAPTSGVTDAVDHMDPTYPVAAARAAFAKGGTDIVVLRVGDVLAITDYFVIASASNPRLVRTIAQEIEDVLAQQDGPRPVRVEGTAEAEWVLADYGEFVVHVFHTDTRDYY
ncbi:MAG: ribosome silencing factor, partial [Acidimicrobiales bacterium]|nr:ribosome silencing factor [Acidimicrobiales bacterium]